MSFVKDVKKSRTDYMRADDHFVVVRQLVYIKSLSPMIAYYLRYKFFSVSNVIKTEGDMV